MSPEERLMEMIVTEIRALRTSQESFQKEVRESQDSFQRYVRTELGTVQKEVHLSQRSIDNLEVKMAFISMIAGGVAAAAFQWVVKVFF